MQLYSTNTVKSKSIHLYLLTPVILKLYWIDNEIFRNDWNNDLKWYVEKMKTERVAFIMTTDKYPCKDTSACLNSGDTPASLWN